MALGGSGGGGSGAVRAGAAFVELYTTDAKLVAGLNRAQARVAGFAKAGAIAAAASGGFLGLLGKASAASLADAATLGEIAAAFQTPVEKLSGLFGLMRSAGSPLKESIESVSQFGTAISNALEGKGETAGELFALIKREATDFKGIDIAEGVYRLFDALKDVQNPLDKTRALSLAFGTDGMKLLLPMLNRTTAELRQQASLYSMSAADIAQATTASRAMTEATARVGRAWDQVYVALAPTIEAISRGVSVAAEYATHFAREYRGATVAVVALAAAVFAVGTGLVVFGSVAGLAAVGIAKVVAAFVAVKAVALGAVGLLLSPWGLLAAAAAAAALAVFDFYMVFGRGAEIAVKAWEGISAAAGSGDLKLAMDVAVAGLAAAWRDGLGLLRQAWSGFSGWFVDGWHDAVTAVSLGFVTLIASLKNLLAAAVADLNRLWNKLPRLLRAGIDPTGLVGEALGAADGVLSGDPEAIKADIRKTAAEEQAKRSMLRANAGLGAAIRSGLATGELNRLVEQAKAKPPKEPDRPNGPTLPRLDKAIGAFIQVANAIQIFGGASLPAQQLAESKRQTNELKQIGVNTGDLKTDLKRLAEAFSFK